MITCLWFWSQLSLQARSLWLGWNIVTKAAWGRNEFVWLGLPGHSHTAEAEQELQGWACGQELKEGPWRMLLTGLLSMSHSARFSYTTQDYLFRSATAHSELGPPLSIIKQDPSQTCQQSNLMEAFFNWGFSSQMTLAGIKLTKLTSMISFIPLGVKKNCLYNISSFHLKESHIILDPLL